VSNLVRVDPRYPGAWDTLSPYLYRAIKEGDGERDWSVEAMYNSAVEGHSALWALVNGDAVFGACLTCVAHYPKRAVLEVLAMAADEGTEPQWRECLEQLIQYAQDLNLQAIVGTGRPGWARKLGAIERRAFELRIE
jgi:hypothetical protein